MAKYGLDKNYLKEEFQKCFEETIPIACEQAMLEILPRSERGNAAAEKFGQTMSKLLSEKWASYMSDAIDVYVKNANIVGFLITTGAPVLHKCKIKSNYPPMMKGVMPNSLKIT